MVRVKYRYLLGELKWKDEKNAVKTLATQNPIAYLLLNALKDSIQRDYGDFGLASVQQGLTGNQLYSK